MGLVHHLLVVGVVAEARVDVVVIGAGVAVVGLLRLVVQQQRRAPEGRGAQVGDVVQVVDDALDVAAVAGHRILAVHLVGRGGDGPGDGRAVVVLAALPGRVIVQEGRGEAVGHDQVDHVRRGEAGAVRAALFPLADQVRILDLLLAVFHDQVVGARGGIGLDFHVHEQVIRTGGLVHRLRGDALPAFDADFLGAHVLALHHQLQRGLHPRPPAERFHARHFLRGRIRNLCRVEGRLAARESGRYGRRHKDPFHHFVRTT